MIYDIYLYYLNKFDIENRWYLYSGNIWGYPRYQCPAPDYEHQHFVTTFYLILLTAQLYAQTKSQAELEGGRNCFWKDMEQVFSYLPT